MNSYTVYVHIFPNDKKYVGITRQDPRKRWNHGGGYRKCPKVYAAIMKFGWDNIEHVILQTGLSKEVAEAEEIRLIKEFDSIVNGYNIEHGGNTIGTHSEETRRKISEANKGRKGHKWTKEEKARISEQTRGENNPFYGCHHSEKVCQAHSDFMKGNQYNKGNHHTDEFKKMKSEQMKEKYSNGGNPRCKTVIHINEDGTTEAFVSLREAARSVGMSPAGLYKKIQTERNWNYG